MNCCNPTSDWTQFDSDFEDLSNITSDQASTDWLESFLDAAPCESATPRCPVGQCYHVPACIASRDDVFPGPPLQQSYALSQAYPSELELLSESNAQADLPELADSVFRFPLPDAFGNPIALVCNQCPNHPVFNRRHLFK